MPPSLRRLPIAYLAAATVALVAATGPVSVARAGSYTVPGTCGQWSPYDTAGSGLTIYAVCPDLYVRNVGSQSVTAPGAAGGRRFDPPAGTAIASVDLQGSLQGFNGWQAAAYTEGTSARELVNCPGVSCPGASTVFQGTYPTFNSGAVVLRVRCGAGGGCSNASLYTEIAELTRSTYTAVNRRISEGRRHLLDR